MQKMIHIIAWPSPQKL